MIEFERVPAPAGSFGRYEYQAVIPFVGGIVIRREATTHAYPRGAANPVWRVYVNDKRRGSHRTLTEAQRHVRMMG